MFTYKKEKAEYLNNLKNYTRVDLDSKKYSGISWKRIEPNKHYFNFKHRYFFELKNDEEGQSKKDEKKQPVWDNDDEYLILKKQERQSRLKKDFEKDSNFPKKAKLSLKEASKLTPAKDSWSTFNPLYEQQKNSNIKNKDSGLELTQNGSVSPTIAKLDSLYKQLSSFGTAMGEQYSNISNFFPIMGNDSFQMIQRFVLPGLGMTQQTGKAAEEFNKYLGDFLDSCGIKWKDLKDQALSSAEAQTNSEKNQNKNDNKEPQTHETNSPNTIIDSLSNIYKDFESIIIKNLVVLKNKLDTELKKDSDTKNGLNTILMIARFCKALEPDMDRFCDIVMRLLTIDLTKYFFDDENFTGFVQISKSYLFMCRNIIHTIAEKTSDSSNLKTIKENAINFNLDMLSDFTTLNENDQEFAGINFVEDENNNIFTSMETIPSEKEKEILQKMNRSDYEAKQKEIAERNQKEKREAFKSLAEVVVQKNYKNSDVSEEKLSSGDFANEVEKTNFTFSFEKEGWKKDLGFNNAKITAGLSNSGGKNKFEEASSMVVYPTNLRSALLAKAKNQILNQEDHLLKKHFKAQNQELDSNVEKLIAPLEKPKIYEGSGKFVEKSIKKDFGEAYEGLYKLESAGKKEEEKSNILKKYCFMFDVNLASTFKAKGMLYADNKSSDKEVNQADDNVKQENFCDKLDNAVSFIETASTKLTTYMEEINTEVQKISKRVSDGKITEGILNKDSDNILKNIATISCKLLEILRFIGITDSKDKVNSKMIQNVISIITTKNSDKPGNVATSNNANDKTMNDSVLKIIFSRIDPKEFRVENLTVNAIETVVSMLRNLSCVSSLTDYKQILSAFKDVATFTSNISVYALVFRLFKSAFGSSDPNEDIFALKSLNDQYKQISPIIDSYLKDAITSMAKKAAESIAQKAAENVAKKAAPKIATAVVGNGPVNIIGNAVSKANHVFTILKLTAFAGGLASEIFNEINSIEINLDGAFSWRDEELSGNSLPIYWSQKDLTDYVKTSYILTFNTKEKDVLEIYDSIIANCNIVKQEFEKGNTDTNKNNPETEELINMETDLKTSNEIKQSMEKIKESNSQTFNTISKEQLTPSEKENLLDQLEENYKSLLKIEEFGKKLKKKNQENHDLAMEKLRSGEQGVLKTIALSPVTAIKGAWRLGKASYGFISKLWG